MEARTTSGTTSPGCLIFLNSAYDPALWASRVKAYEYVELAVEDHVASDLGGQQSCVEMPAEDPIRLPILECALLPLGGPDALWMPRIEDHYLRCNVFGPPCNKTSAHSGRSSPYRCEAKNRPTDWLARGRRKASARTTGT